MNVLLITPWYPHPAHPQDGNFVRAQAELLARNHQVEVLFVYEGARPQVQCEVEKSGVRVVRSAYQSDGHRLQRILRRRKAWQAALSQRKLLPELIHAHILIDGGIVAARLARELGVPFVVTEHSHRWLAHWPLLRQAERWLARWAARGAAALIPVSPSLQRGMETHGIKGQYEVIPNVVDTGLFRPAAPENGRAFTFLHVSDFSQNKHIADLVEAFTAVLEEYPDVLLHIAGNGDQPMLTEYINRSSHRRPRPIKLTGPHTPQEIADIMRHSDAFVLTSGLETQSLVLIEAQLSGLPCISTRSGGPEDIISTPSRGQLIPLRDVSALAEAMRRFVAAGPASLPDRQLRSRSAHADFGRVDEQLNDLYHRILS